ncbi:MAG: L,D-transpeptidase [Polyangiaceae bacterium]
MRQSSWGGWCAAGALVVMAMASVGCAKAKADPSLSKQVKPGAAPTNVPVPPENGPKLHTVKRGAKVFDKPGGAEIGELLVGGAVSRSAETMSGTDACPAGFYAVRPRGFVCSDDKVAVTPGSAAREPDLEHALPYRYGRANATTPLYARVPTPDEQVASEPALGKHLVKSDKAATAVIHTGANDVPVDERGVATGGAVMTKASQGADSNGHRTRASFFEFNEAPAPSTSSGDAVATVLRKGSAVAISGTFMAPGPAGARRFGVLPDGTFLPVDRLDPILGSVFHGVDLAKDVALPIAFVLRNEVCPYRIANAKATRLEDEEVDKRTPVELTNKWREIDHVRYEETKDGNFFREKDIIKIVKRTKFPDFVVGDTKWIDVSLALQTLTLYEGRKPIYVTMISSGEGPLGDPATTPATQMGTFKITKKAVFGDVDPKESKEAFDLVAAPWSLEFSPGYALRGAFWTENMGEAHAFHSINLSPIDARRIYQWVGGDVPVGWLGAAVPEEVTVYVRK